MITPNYLKLIRVAASKDAERLALAYVRVDEHAIWATDGHRLIEVEIDTDLAECGAYHAKSLKRDPDPPEAPNYKAVMPKETLPLCTLTPGIIDELRFLARCISPHATATVSFKPGKGVEIDIARDATDAVRRKNPKVIERTTLYPKWEGPETPIGFGLNIRYLLDAINTRPVAGEVLLETEEWGESKSILTPIVIRFGNVTNVIMPVRV